MTPIHDHLAWGLIGLYRGNQDEEIYRPGEGTIELARRRPLEPGDFYALLPPRDDVHRVRTTSADASVSLHLLANDTGCVLRHTYDEATGQASPFRSGYVNAPCEEDPHHAAATQLESRHDQIPAHHAARHRSRREPHVLRGARDGVPPGGQIVRDGNHEATLYFFGFPGEEVELELTYNTDGRSYELGTAYGHIAVRVDDMGATLSELAGQGIEPERAPYQRQRGRQPDLLRPGPDGYRIELIERSSG